MSDIGKNALKNLIDSAITENETGAITGTVMNGVLQDAVDTLANGENLDAGSVKTANIANGAITTEKVAATAITEAKIANDAVTTNKIASKAVTTAKVENKAINTSKLDDGAVTADKIAASAVTTAKVNDSAITTAKINDSAVTTAKIADANVTTDKIADSNVTAAKIGANAVETAKIKDGNVTTAKLDDEAVTTAKIADEAVTTAKIADNNITTDKVADGAITDAKLANPISVSQDAEAGTTTITVGSDSYDVATEPVSVSQNTLSIGGNYAGEMSTTYDVTLHNSGTTFASLEALLSDANINTLIPLAVRKGGMSIKFVQSSDNKYVQYRLTKDEWSVFHSDWIEADSNKVEDKVFYVTDGSGNIIAKIDKDGVHSVDFKIGSNGDSVAEAINGISGQISSAVNAEKLLREQGDTTVTGLVEAEEARAKAAEDTKINYTITDDKFCITDANGYIICQIDASGVHSVNIEEHPEIIANNNLTIMDSNGYIIAKIDASGVHSAKDKHAVACMVLSESYYPTATPTRDSEGNITYVEVMFETGIGGSLSITYTNGNSSSVAVVYGNYNYTITINRDNEGNIETVSVN